MPIQDLVGKEFPLFAMPIERGKIREFANAIGDDNPIYLDPAYAGKSGFGDIPAPPRPLSRRRRRSGARPGSSPSSPALIPGSGFTGKKNMSTTSPSWPEMF